MLIPQSFRETVDEWDQHERGREKYSRPLYTMSVLKIGLFHILHKQKNPE